MLMQRLKELALCGIVALFLFVAFVAILAF
jgi:hypothetical protein